MGSALGRNPVPVLIPCHRVVRSDGQIGNYGLGVPMKRALLSAEGVDIERLERLADAGVRYIGSDTTDVFCVPSCVHARRIRPAHEVRFRTAAAALEAGYRPCAHCTPAAVRDASVSRPRGSRGPCLVEPAPPVALRRVTARPITDAARGDGAGASRRGAVEELVPEDRPSARQGPAHERVGEDPPHHRGRGRPSHQGGMGGRRDPVVVEVVRRATGAIARPRRHRARPAPPRRRGARSSWRGRCPRPAAGSRARRRPPTSRTRPAAGVVPTMPILSQPPSRPGPDPSPGLSTSPCAGGARGRRGGAAPPPPRPAGPTRCRCRGRRWPARRARGRASRSRGRRARARAPTTRCAGSATGSSR